MNVIVVDDERIVLEAETKSIKRVFSNEQVNSFQRTRETLEFAKYNKVDIAFLDTNIRNVTGLQLAKQLQEYNQKVNIIFCTSYGESPFEELDLCASAFLMKPITDEKVGKALEQLKHQIDGLGGNNVSEAL